MTSPALFSASPSLHHHHYTTIFSLPPSSCPCYFPRSPTTKTSERKTLSTIKATSDSTTIVDDPSVASSSGASISASLYTEEDNKEEAKIGARVRVTVPLKVYHIPKVPEFELNGIEGVLKQYVGVWKGKRISANLPFKVAFVADIEGRDGPVKFFTHLKDDEFEYLD